MCKAVKLHNSVYYYHKQNLENLYKKANEELDKRIKEEYEKRNSTASLDKKIFSIRVLRQQLKEQKMQYINEIEESNYLLKPENFIKEKNKAQKQKELFEILNYTEEEKEKLRGAIRYFSGDKNNINVQVKVDGELKPSGQIYLTDDIKEVFDEILGRDKVVIN